jgi:hypothetical protein
MSTYQELTNTLVATIDKVEKGTISLAKAKVIDRMANSVIRLAILQLRHSAPTNPLEVGFQNESIPLLEENKSKI